jgi:DNA-binding NarL/FixJ family response regulator
VSLSRYDLLTEREQQIFRLIAQGNSSREIADFLCISGKTVEKHRSHIMNKLGLRDRFDLLKYAIKIGIMDPETWNE